MTKNQKTSKTTSNTASKTGRPFDPAYMRPSEYREEKTPAVRPKDAATLILVRHDDNSPRILMGKRNADHKFMPNKYVFPGGRVDIADSRIKPAKDLTDTVQCQLMDRMRGKPSLARARSYALAAVRETFEETGLVVGTRNEGAAPKSRHTDWNAYFQQGALPDLSKFDMIARAITPPYRNRRFDTRFFMGDASAILSDMHDTAGASGELLDLHWLTISEARDVDLPNITRMVIAEIESRLKAHGDISKRPVPFVYFRGAKPIQDKITV
ncbi:MAG: NUDIX hydrolase [Candidatus Phaeomarinobacter sp.]